MTSVFYVDALFKQPGAKDALLYPKCNFAVVGKGDFDKAVKALKAAQEALHRLGYEAGELAAGHSITTVTSDAQRMKRYARGAVESSHVALLELGETTAASYYGVFS